MKINSKTIVVITGAVIASFGNAHAAGADALFILPIGFVFIVAVLMAILRNASPGRKPVVRVVAVSHVVCWLFVGFVAFRYGGKFRIVSVDAADVYVIYPAAAALYLFFTYNLSNSAKSDKSFVYALLYSNAIAFIVVGLLIYLAIV